MIDTGKDSRQVLLELANEILQEYQSLSFRLQDLLEEISPAEYQYYTIEFENILNKFNRFSEGFREAGFPADADIRDSRQKLSRCFTQFYQLRTGFFNQYAARSAALEIEDDLEYTPAAEDAEEEDVPLAEEDAVSSEPDADCERKKSPKRTIRRPRIHSPEEQARQQAQREMAVLTGMQIHPDQTVTEADLIRHRLQMEEQQRILAETTAENIRQQDEWLTSYRERMERAINFDRLGNQHIDMSKESMDPSGTHDAGSPDQSSVSGPQTTAVVPTAVPGSASQSAASNARCYHLSRITQTIGAVSYVAFSAADKASRATPISHNGVPETAPGRFYISDPVNRSTLQHHSEPLTAAELATRNREAIHRYRILKSQLHGIQEQLSAIPDTAQDARSVQHRQQLQAQLSDYRQQLPTAQKAIMQSRQVQRFLHERKMDQELLELIPGKSSMPQSTKTLNAQSQEITRNATGSMRRKYGELASVSDEVLRSRLQELTSTGKALKIQLQQLESRRAPLSASERLYLAELKGKTKEVGAEISQLVGLSRARSDLAYKQSKLAAIATRESQYPQRTDPYLVRTLAMQSRYAVRQLGNKNAGEIPYSNIRKKSVHLSRYGQRFAEPAGTPAAGAGGHNTHRYSLNRITTIAGNVSHMIFAAAVQKTAQATEDDTVSSIMTGSYYLSMGTGIGRAALTTPAGALLHSAKAVTGTELVRIHRENVLQYQRLRSKIGAVHSQLAAISETSQDKLSARRRQLLQSQLSALQQQLPKAEVKLARSRQTQQFLHERKLDRELADQLKVNGKIPRNTKHLNERSQQILRNAEKNGAKKYGDLAAMPDKELRSRIERLTVEARAIKRQIQQLEGKGALLSTAERQQLMKLKAKTKEIGKEICQLTSLSRARSDLAYKEKRLNAMLRTAGRRRQQLANSMRLVRSFALRPLYAGTDSDTEGLAYAASWATDPMARKAAKTLITAPVKFPAKLTGRILRRAAPELYSRILHQKNEAAKKLHHVDSAPKRILHRAAKDTAKAAYRAVPAGVKNAVGKATAPVRYLHRKYDAVVRRIHGAGEWFAGTRAGRGLIRLQRFGKNLFAGLRFVGSTVKSAALWAVVGYLALALLIACTGAQLTAAVSTRTLILSTAESKTNDKIDLSPYAKIIKSAMIRFTQRIEILSDKYEEDPDYDNVEVTYMTKINNTREMLSMMAVRMKQELDLHLNAEIYDYLKELFEVSHSLTIMEHEYTCSGCEYRRKKVGMEWDPVTGMDRPVYEWVTYCDGHIDANFVVNVMFFDALFYADTYETKRDDWEGWTKENIEWCKTIYEMDWLTLYDGVIVPGGTSPNVVIDSEHEEHIWNYLLDMTGNAYAAAGIMGNLYSGSELNASNLEDKYEDLLGYDDTTYTNAVNNGSYTRFQEDNVGYGLAQWSDPEQKAALFDFAQAAGKSIGSLDMQLAYLTQDLAQSEVIDDLRRAESVRAASDLFLKHLNSGNESAETTETIRADCGSYFYNKYVLGISAEGTLTKKQIEVIRVATDSANHGIAATGGYCQRWAAQVYAVAGFPLDSSCCAYHSGLNYGVSGDWDHIPPGAAVYGYAGNKYGHVGIYVGNGLVYHNVGGVQVDTLEMWVRVNDGFAWGWEGGTDLTIPD